MGFHIPILAFELGDIGLIPRRRIQVTKLYDLVEMFPEKSENQYRIHPDVNGEYSFSNEMLQFDRPYQVFYDGEQKVLEAFYDKHSFILNILTDKQTNLFLDVTANECVIKAHGPLCIDGKLRLKSALTISANALCFLDAIDFDGTITLTAQQGIGLLASLRAKQLNITAAYLYQSADIAISQYDLSVQVFQQIKGSKTDINSLRLVSEQCEIVGEFSVNESCFIAANNLLMGDNKSVTRIELPADHHIHVVNSVARGQSSTVVGREFEVATQGSKERAQCIVDESFYVDKRACFVFHNTRFAANRVESRGDWLLNHCLVAIQLTNIRGGSFVLSHSDLLGEKINAFSGAMTIDNHSRIDLTQSLITDESVHFVMNKSEAHAQQKILLFGTITMNRANVHAESFRAYQTVTLKKTQITAQSFFELQGDLKLNKVAIQSQTVLFAGILDINDTTVNARTVDYQSQQASVVKHFVRADCISIDGSESKGNMAIVDSRLVFNTIAVKQYVVVQNTSLVGVDDANICHNIEGLLSLEQSQFISQNQLQPLIGSHLELCEYSHVLSGHIDSKGDISAQDSAIYCDGLMQDGGSIRAKSSKIHINETLSAQNAELSFDGGSMVSASHVILRQGSNMRLSGVSILAAREQVIIGADTALQSHDSTSHARKFSVLGRAELCASLLSAQELLIYDQFGALDKTIIQVDERISLAKTAHMQLSSSHMTARNIDTFGVLDVIKSSIHAKDTISLWSTSTSSVQESTSVVAEDAILRGQLIIKKKIDEDDKTPSTIPAKPILQIKKQMDISPLGRITGDEDLFIDAEEINQSGTIELTGNFCAKGRQFTNVGSVIAPSIYLGFDDAVINHGIFSAKSVTVHSNFMNILGQVYARESLSCSGFVSLNMGLIAANNYINDSFVSLNAGLIAPNLSADPKYIFSMNNLAMVAKTAAMMWLPGHASGIQLFSMIPGFFSTAVNLYHLSNRLDWETLKNMRRHEFMPILCQIKNACMFGRGLFTSASSFGSEFSAWDSSFTKMTHDPSAWASDLRTTFQSTDWKKMSLRTAGAFGGSYTDTSLLHVNLGASVAANTSKTNFMHLNLGAEQSLFSHNINTCRFYNTGYSAGYESSFSATSINNSGSLVGTSQFTLRANRVNNHKTGTLKGAQANVAIDELHQDGALSIEKGQLKIKHFTDSTDAHTQLTGVALSGNTLIQDGEFKLKDVYIHEDESVTTGVHSKGTTDNVTIETKVFTHMGQLDYEHTLTVKAETAILAKGSILSGQTTEEDKLFVPKKDEKKDVLTEASTSGDESTENAAVDNAETDTTKEPEREFKPQHVFSILAAKTTLSGRLSGGDYTQIQGQITDTMGADGTKEIDLCEEFIIGNSALIDLKHGSVAAKKSTMSGETALNGFQLNIKENSLTQDGVLKLNGTNYTGDSFHSSGLLIAEKGQLAIKEFHDTADAHTQLTDIVLLGATLDQEGEFKLKNVYIQESDHVTTGTHSTGNMDNVTIETKKFTHTGQLNYEHTLTIKAETATFVKGSVVNGQKTDEDKLFVPKQMITNEVDLAADSTPSSSEDNTEKSKPKEIEKEFKPEHTLNILVQKVTLDGRLSGGDYTQIRGRGSDTTNADDTKEADLCDEVIIGDSASIDLKYGSIDAKKSNISGNTVLDSFQINIKENVVNQDGVLKLTHSNFTGDVLDSSGLLILDHTHVDIASIHLAKDAHEQLIDSNLYSKQILDESQLSYQGQVGVVTDDYQHTGHVQKKTQPEDSESKNLFYVQSKTGRLDGSGDIDNGYYNIEHLGDGTAFVAGRGKYSLYMTSESLSFVTQDSFHLSDTIERDCDISVQASDILFGTSYYRPHDLTLISTVDDVVLTGAIQSSNLYAKSARNLLTNNSIGTTSTLSFEAEGGYYNYGGLLNGDVVAVKAGEIKNFTQGSAAASQGTRLPMGGSGVINARSKLFLEATQGNIENHGGIMRAGDYTQLLAVGNVVNSCNERSYQGEYDILKEFSGGLISGGNGASTDGIGLYIKAEGTVISDASDFVSNGSNYIEGVQGVSFTARQHTYVSLDRTDKTWYGKKTHVVETSTTVKGSVVHSNNGRNIIQSGEGGVTSIATRFSSPGGTDVYAKGNVQLFSLNAQNHRFESHSNFWGLSKNERDHIYESSTPTLFLDNGATRICSSEGNVDARGAYFIGGGDLSIKAKGRIQFGVDILDHELNEKTRSFNLKAPGLGAWDSYKQGGSLWDMATAEDATLAKLNSLSNSHNTAEFLANSSNLGIDLVNTTNSMMRGLGQDGITYELMARYGLGGAAGFSPSLTLSMTESKTTSHFQTQAQGGVDRGGNVRLEAGEGIDLENGVRVHAGGDLEIDAPEVIAHAAALQSSVKQTTQSESIGATLTGQVQNVGASYSKTQTSSTHYINAELSAGGNMLLHNQDKAMDKLELDGANLIAGSLDANIHQLIIRDKQDASQTKTKSFSASTNGQFSVYEGHGFDKVTEQHSGIHVTDGINTNGHGVHVNETYMEGGVITTEGENHFTTDKLVSVTLQDERQYSGIGISGNINDFNRLIDGKPANVAGEQTFATAAVMFDHIDYAATQTAVIYGEKGTTLDINTLQGEVHTESADGKSIQHDDSIHLQLDIPLTNKDYLEKRSENMKAGEAKLSEFFKPKPHQDEAVAFGRHEPIRPVENNAEEKDDEDAEDKKNKHPKKKKDEHTSTDSDKPKKDMVKTEPELSPEITQDIVDDALKHLKFDSPKAERAFNKTVEDAQHEKETTGKVSSKTEDALKRQITTALIKTLKAGTEEGWGKFVEKLGPDYNQKLIKLLSNPDTFSQAGVKTYLGTKGALITFTFNLALSSLDDEVAKGDVLKHSAAVTAVDFSFGVVLEYGLERLAMGEAVGPIGWGLMVLDVVDSFYSPEQINKFIEQGISNLYEAQSLYRDGHPFAGWALERAAADKIGAAARAQCGHIIAEMMKPVIAKVESVFDKPVQQLPMRPTSPASNQKFFKSDVTHTSEHNEKNTREQAVSW
ncbi:MAG: hemagglutinin repeat-containing protein [Legionellaceae bacterium]|nr:hemagglutinin repeat-containing protein [Legionellaceae bacterium]